MTATRLSIPEQDHQRSTQNLRWHDSRAVSEELPRQTQSHLVVRKQKNQNGDGEVLVIPGLWTRWSTPPFRMTQNNQRRLRNSKQKKNHSALMIALSREESLHPLQEQSSKTSGRRQERLADAHGSATPAPPDSMRPAATPREAPNVAAKREVISLVAGARPRHRPSFHPHDLDPDAPGAWTLPPAAATSPPAPPAFHHARPRKRRWASSVRFP